MEQNNYHSIRRISASLLSHFEWIHKNNLSLDLLKTKPKSEAMDLGSFIHKSIELGGIDWYTTLDYSILNKIGLKDYEQKLVQKGLTVDNYCAVYTNKLTKSYQAGDFDAASEILSILEELRIKAKDWIDYKDSIDKPVLDDFFPNVNKADYTIVRCYSALSPVIEKFGSLEKERVVEWSYEGLPCKSMIDLSNDNLIIDIKTYSDDIHANVRKYGYVRQLSFYRESMDVDNVYIIGVNTKYFNVNVIKLSDYDLDCGKNGGRLKPSWMTKGENYFMTPSQQQIMFNLDLWNKEDVKEFHSYGFHELIQLLKSQNYEEVLNHYYAD